jgi:DNA mismatch repair ATPase MutS
MFAVIAPVLLWATQLAFAIEAWRVEHAASVRRWLGAVGELEALLDLAAYAWERPDDPFPELEEEGPRFVAEALGHPLIPDSECVRNDVRLDAGLRLYVVSGSNMSGKSTLLRSVGINAVLGLAGAPVRARSLQLSPIAVGASLRVLDSLQDGISHFQAEILRMRLIAARAGGERPLLFLLDEIFQGTNSHDRVHGATAIVRGLVERGSIGLVSTHDLALTEIVGALGPRAANVHFEDVLVDGEMSFDYRLREGVVQRSNAVALMRAVGLEV